MRLDLNGNWKMKSVEAREWLDAKVPGTVYSDLFAAGKVPEAYYRDNEVAVQSLFETDYEYVRTFFVDDALLSFDSLVLCCEGLDTLASIMLNDQPVAETNNMHRTWRLDVRSLLRQGENKLSILFHSPVQFVKKVEEENPGVTGTTFLRKAACMFGWDWGLSLPDSGIWRDIYVEGINTARIADALVLQHHFTDKVELELQLELEHFNAGDLCIHLKVSDPDGRIIVAESTPASEGNNLTATIRSPKLWWPAGQGEQPLYQIDLTLMASGTVLDTKMFRVGLRDIKLLREKDTNGSDSGFAFAVNGRRIFAKGANMIIPDAILSQRSIERTEKMIHDSVEANCNCIRIWGGAFYPDNYFYDLCDEYGLLVFHDFMFACNFYPTDEAFLDNVRAEVADNLKRARNHASIALWCGNNEIEMCLYVFSSPEMEKFFTEVGGTPLRLTPEQMDYLKSNIITLFYDIIGSMVKTLAPQTSYIASSPISDEPFITSSTSGDAHYYLSYDNMRPYREFRSQNFRFLSEIGFQSYPDIKTIESFTEEDDRNPYTPVMIQHQKYHKGNEVLETYLEQDYKVPTDFKKYVYASQALNSDITAYCIEHTRRNTCYSMGYLVWQLNDCWPTVSWAGVDYYGRWKGQQYRLKRAFAPIMVSALDDGTKVGLYVNNDCPALVKADVMWTLYNRDENSVKEGCSQVKILPQTAMCAVEVDFSDIIKGKEKHHYLAYSAFVDDVEVSSSVMLFVSPKEYIFCPPNIQFSIMDEGDQYHISFISNALAFNVALELQNCDAIFSDNFFHLLPDTAKSIYLKKSDMSKMLDTDEIKEQLSWLTAYDLQ